MWLWNIELTMCGVPKINFGYLDQMIPYTPGHKHCFWRNSKIKATLSHPPCAAYQDGLASQFTTLEEKQ